MKKGRRPDCSGTATTSLTNRNGTSVMNIEQSTDTAVMGALHSCQDILQRRHQRHAAVVERAETDDDMRFNTDFVIYTVAKMRIACRVRSNSYIDKYGDEFTIRSKTRFGCRTELDKLIDGWGDFLFYGFANQGGDSLAQWIIGDLSVWRDWNTTRAAAGLPAGIEQSNWDGTGFRAYRIKDLPPDFVVCQYDHTGFRYPQEALF